ncbi:MAG: enoyl-CoA hydratase/isomerase family protein [Deltaproteobacteria bacterium]|nr:enoyl-CoA hydratase/isomerase family protein [Deltaproteobacteria bacterium]OQY16260.1 MAG: enoyl-CoA hydratase [Desulfobacterium sp. 4572_20]HDH88030.1 enoyl-CoA hydratase/isomerase family protein [Desulfobacteraceae bacterium]MBW2331937.1 enoyl-CoA hydratase/isomerase family protein [Deltaproteobacteria bacterium]MCD6266629.1 enoyl-CoA hydratase/isomerase family protein [Deltaproteobacteria bacterium]
MSYETILFSKEEDIAIIKFNRPKVLNAINPTVVSEMADVLRKIDTDTSIKVLILTGEGDRAFVAGADIASMKDYTPLEGKFFSRQGQELLFQLEALSIPVIACVNGFALGGGTEIAMACDFIYAADSAKFGQPEINLGIIPGFGGTQRLSRLVGKSMAKELCMTGIMITAQEAKEIGLVNRVFPKESLWEETMKVAKVLASKGKVSIRAVKEAIQRGYDQDLRTGCYLESDAFGICMASDDAREGMGAFLEKRKAEFKGELL